MIGAGITTVISTLLVPFGLGFYRPDSRCTVAPHHCLPLQDRPVAKITKGVLRQPSDRAFRMAREGDRPTAPNKQTDTLYLTQNAAQRF